jgi:hypothetical protein
MLIAFLILPAVGMAADFELFWDPNCGADPALEGYFIYYTDEVSVTHDPSDAMEIYVPLSESGFDPDAPSYPVSGLMDDKLYCFTVSAWYGDEESGMSNEICGINGVYKPSPGGGFSDASANHSSGSCFIGVLE